MWGGFKGTVKHGPKQGFDCGVITFDGGAVHSSSWRIGRVHRLLLGPCTPLKLLYHDRSHDMFCL